jgi:hypothetical protein
VLVQRTDFSVEKDGNDETMINDSVCVHLGAVELRQSPTGDLNTRDSIRLYKWVNFYLLEKRLRKYKKYSTEKNSLKGHSTAIFLHADFPFKTRPPTSWFIL